MNENNKTHISSAEVQEEFDLEDILAEYAAEPEAPPTAETLGERSRRIAMETIDDPAGETGVRLGGIIDDAAAAAAAAQPAPQPKPEPEPEPETLTPEDEAVIDALAAEEIRDSAEGDAYAAPLDESEPLPPEEPKARRGTPQKSARERFLSPLVALLALVAMRRERRSTGERNRPTAEAEDADAPEMEPKKAAKLYGAQMASLRRRGRIAAALTLVMIYLSFAWSSAALPLTGALNGNLRVVSLLLLVLELSVCIVGLDVFTGGLVGIARRRMGPESLVAASCLLSLLDAVVMAAARPEGLGIPLSAVSAASMTAAIWGEYFGCKGLRTGFRVLSASKTLYTVTGETGITQDDVALLKSRRSVKGFIRRSEEADAGEYLYSVLTPILLAASLILGLLASVAHGHANAVVHCISMLCAAAATFSCTLCFTLPFAVSAKKLFASGAAIAGWSGVRDIGRARHVVITDQDIFPRGTAEISRVRILEGAFTDKVISYTGSVIAASGCGLAAPFSELIRRNGYTISRVEGFEPHDGGGMTAVVNGETVCVGNTGFMNLMGIRLPQKLSTRSSVYTAINGALVGIFTVEYKPVSSVQDALVLLLHSKLEPIFAIRDFNITPMMIKTKFKMPTDSFRFPAYAERYRISGAEPDSASRVAAVLAREGMGPLVDAAERGRRTYTGARAAAIVSAVGSVFGVLLLFLLCWLGAFESASASNVLIFMLLWLLPLILVVFGLER